MVGAVLIFGGDVPMPNNVGDWFSTVTLVRVTDVQTPLSVAWTLFYEIAFYALFALLILNRLTGVLIFASWAIIIVALHRYTRSNSPLGVWTSMVCINFFIGMAACWLHSRLRPWVAWALVAAGIIGLCLCGLFVDHGLSIAAFQLGIAVTSGLAICGIASIETRTPLNFGWLATVGNASYTLYLVHGHLTPFILKMMRKVGLFAVLSADVIFIISLAATTAAAVALYLLVEKPLARWLKSPTRLAAPAAIATGASSDHRLP